MESKLCDSENQMAKLRRCFLMEAPLLRELIHLSLTNSKCRSELDNYTDLKTVLNQDLTSSLQDINTTLTNVFLELEEKVKISKIVKLRLLNSQKKSVLKKIIFCLMKPHLRILHIIF